MPDIYTEYLFTDKQIIKIPLSRYIPPLPPGIVTRWLKLNLLDQYQKEKNMWILDPFGSSPTLPIEIAKAGYKIIVAVNNPIICLLIELLANPPRKEQLIATLADLASSRKGEESLESHIKSLYTTTCDICGNDTLVDEYIWEQGNDEKNSHPILKIIHCNHCNSSGEFSLTEKDYELLKKISSITLHRTRAIERVVRLNDRVRKNVEEIIDLYTPRSIYSLFSLINKRESIIETPEKIKFINALLLSAFDEVSSLWSYPSSRARPKQLFIPQLFREYNLWLALENAINLWSAISEKEEFSNVSVTQWPELPKKEGGVCIYEGKVKDLINQIRDFKIGAIITALPRPNQAFWSLSSVWSGWLWGTEKVKTMKNVLTRKRYDWGWLTLALSSALNPVSQILKEDTPFFGLVGEIEPGFLTAILAAADITDYQLSGIAMRTEGGNAQLNWIYSKHKKDLPIRSLPKNDSNLLIRKLQNNFTKVLLSRSEPMNYPQIHLAGLCKLVTSIKDEKNKSSFVRQLYADKINAFEFPGRIHSLIEESLIHQQVFIRLGGSTKSIEVGQWYLRDDIINSSETTESLSDRVEKYIVKKLLEEDQLDENEIHKEICTLFTGLNTPSADFIQVCLESYAKRVAGLEGIWQLNPQDHPHARTVEIKQMIDLLKQIAQNLGYSYHDGEIMIWKDNNNAVRSIWKITTSGIIEKLLLQEKADPQLCYILIPGSRSNIITYKINHDIRLQNAVETGWQFVKFRQIRAIAENPILYPELFRDQLKHDTLTYNAPQSRII